MTEDRRGGAATEVAYVLAGWLLVVSGAVVLVAGWLGISREALVARQLPYLLSGGAGGLALVVVGATLLAVRDVRAVGGRLSGLEREVAELREELRPPLAPPFEDGVRVVPGGEHFHNPGCPVVVGKPGVTSMPATAAAERGLSACRLCSAPG